MNTFTRAIGILCGCVAVSSGQLVRQANTTLTFPPDLPSASGYTVPNAFGTLQFSQPMCTAFVPGETNRLFIAERGGQIRVMPNMAAPTNEFYLNLTSLLTAGQTLDANGENGFLSLAFHPNFATNRTLFVYFTIDVGGVDFQRLHQVTVSSATATTVTISQHKPLLTILDRDTNHNGGAINFGPDGYLYLSTGDEGGSNDTRNNARFINFRNVSGARRPGFWGQLLRIAVEVDPVGQPGVYPPNTVSPNPQTQNSATFPSALHGNYQVPLDNPFHGYTLWHSQTIDPATVRTEIFATGLRNPFRWSFDPPTGRIFLADVGQGAWEEVNIIAKGDDMGWSWREGLHAFTAAPPYPDATGTTTPPPPPQPGDPLGTGFSPRSPIFEYDRTSTGAPIHGTSVTGGIVYRGNQMSELFGRFLFADFNSGRIAALRESNGAWTAQRLVSSEPGIVHFGYDPRNSEVLMCDLADNVVRRLVRSGTTGTNPPALLSGTGAFSNLSTLTANAGIVPYEPIVHLWSDYASKQRWFSIKNLTDKVTFSTDGNWTFPTGMVWVKHFDIETTRGNPATKRKLETRFLVKTATDIYGLSYRWKADQSDADLVPEEGITEVIPTSSPAQTWRYPSRSECRACHNSLAGFALSFHTRQLNLDNVYGALTQNQIAALSSAGYFSAEVGNVNNLPAFSAPGDTTKSLESRVRAYLSVNCVQCHQPNGTATGTWDARITTSTDSANLINGILANNFGDPDDRFAVPGNVGNSMVLKRLQGAGVPRMPPLLTTERDLVSEQLVIDWINSLTTRQSLTQWQTTHFGSPSAPNAAPNADPDFDGQINSLEYLQSTSPTSVGLPILPGLDLPNGEIQITFTHPANRSAVVETSTNLTTWSLWNVPGNRPFFPAADTPRTLTGPKEGPNRHFRLRLGEL